MEDTSLLCENDGYILRDYDRDSYGMLKKIKTTNKRVFFVMFFFLIAIVAENILIFLFMLKIKSTALGWIDSDEMFEYKEKIEKLIDEACRLYVKC